MIFLFSFLTFRAIEKREKEEREEEKDLSRANTAIKYSGQTNESDRKEKVDVKYLIGIKSG